VACGIDAASVPVEAGVPLLVEVQRGTLQGTADLRIELTPEPDAGAAAVLAWVVLAVLARRIRRRGPGRLAEVAGDPAPDAG
jgi:MYXO-CTERM domain-containing protein